MKRENLPVAPGSVPGTSLAQPLAPLADYAAPVEDEPGLNWRRYVAALVRYKWLILAVTILGTAAGVVGSRNAKPTYVAEATILVPERTTRNDPIQPDVLFQTFGWVELIKTSYIVLDNVVRELHLYVQPVSVDDSLAVSTLGLKSSFQPGAYELLASADGQSYVLRSADGTVLERGALGDSIGRELGLAWVPPPGSIQPGRTVGFRLVPPRDVARTLQASVQAQIKERGANMLAVSLEGDSPFRVTALVNRIASGFVDSARALSLSKHRELTHTLKMQLDSAERRLSESEIAYERFRVSTYTLPQERGTPVTPGVRGMSNPALDNYTNMRFELDGLRRDQEAIEQALAAMGDSGLSADQLGYVGVVQQSSELQSTLTTLTNKQAELTTLRLRYTDQNPNVLRSERDVAQLRTRTIPDLARGLLAQTKTRERDLSERVAAAGHELQQIPVRATEEQRLSREEALAASRYQDVQKQYQNALYAEAAEELGARVLDSAVVPTRPIRDTALRILAAGVIVGIGLGLFAAIALDFFDPRVRYPEQVSSGLGLPILGAVPRIKVGAGGRSATRPGAVQVVEALRGIRLAIIHAHGAAGPLMVTITSPGPAEGKSFVTSNLALAFADAGHRTLLIDGDVRRGELHRLLEAQRKPGLTDYLQGSVQREAILQRTRYPSLTFIGGGTRMHSAPELLSSPALGQLLLSLRSAYDVLLVDSPPLGAGVDPFVLATATGSLVLVMRTGVTDRELAEAKLDMLDRLPIRILGAILNDVQPGGAYRYYGYQYYIDGYGTQDEAAEEAPPQLRAPKVS